jgi:hypothetical protein
MKRFHSSSTLAFTITVVSLVLSSQVAARTTTSSLNSTRTTSADTRIAIFAGSASGNPPDSPEKRVDLNTATSPYAGVGSVGGYCSGVVIAPTYVLTAGHCNPGPGNSGVSFLLNTSANPIWIPIINAVQSPVTDLAILKLGSPVPVGVPIYSLSRNPLQLGTTITMVGYGQSGYGGLITAEITSTIKRVGQNVVDLINQGTNQDSFTFDFDGPDASTNTLGGLTLGNDIETGLGGGDSGSPSFISTGNTLSIIGINTASFVPSYSGTNPGFGKNGGGVQIYNNLAWIDSTLAALPVISSFTPSSGAAGRVIQVNGTNLESVDSVKVGDISAFFVVNSPTQIAVTLPANASSGAVTITNFAGSTTSNAFSLTPGLVAQIYGSGESSAALVNRAWFDIYGVPLPPNASPQTGEPPVNPNYQFQYLSTNRADNTDGKRVFLSQTPPSRSIYTTNITPTYSYPRVDFAITKSPLTSAELSQAVSLNRGQPVQVPVVASALSLAYNPGINLNIQTSDGLLHISRKSFCGIVTKKITRWDDPSLTADNSNVPLASKTLTFVAPIASVDTTSGAVNTSGNADLISVYANQVCNQPGSIYPWTFGTGSSLQWPQTITQRAFDSAETASKIMSSTSTAYIGFLENVYTQPYTLSPAPVPSSLQNSSGKFNYPGVQSASKALTSATVTSNPSFSNVLTVSNSIDPSDPNAFPIVNVEYFLFYGNYNLAPSSVSSGLKALMNWALQDSTSSRYLLPVPVAYAQGYGFTPFSNTIRGAARAAVNNGITP